MSFHKLAAQKAKTLLPGVTIRPAWGERIMVVYLALESNALVPDHTHPHEQMGYILEGSMEMTIGDEKKLVKKGDGYLIPSNATHRALAGPDGAVALDIFSPPREEYKPDIPVIAIR